MTLYEEFKELMESRFNELVERFDNVKNNDMSDCYTTETKSICYARLIAEIERMQWVLEMLPEDPNEEVKGI